MKRLVLFAAAQVIMGSVWAQQIVSTRVMAPPCGQFYVDGTPFTNVAVFLWPVGSLHTLSIGESYPVSPGVECNVTGTSWVDSNGHTVPPGGPTVTVVADPSITYYQTTAELDYRVNIVMDNEGLTALLSCNQSANPGAGQLLVNGTCYSSDSQIWLSAGTLMTIQAIPPQGWVFAGWLPGQYSGITTASGSFTLTMPVTIGPLFLPGDPVTLLTSPPQMKLIADGTLLISPASLTWAMNSSHSLTGVDPQVDAIGRPWVWQSWSQGGPETQVYSTGGYLGPITLTATYALAGQVTFGTSPQGLQLTIDGRSNWPTYSFIWAVGSTHTLSAPLQQASQGRQYTFDNWSTGVSGANQQYTVATSGQVGVLATYDVMGQLRILSSPNSVSVLVDGVACQTPCVVDRTPGAQAVVIAPASVQLTAMSRLDFTSWSDGAPRQRTWTADTNVTTLMVNYQTSNLVQAVSNPASGATFQFSPASPDGYYVANTNVTVTVVPQPGYKFTGWSGDVTGTSTSLQVNTSLPVYMIAEMTPVPFIQPTGVRNAAGDGTPPVAVAPGSLITIYGGALAPDTVAGPAGTLAQTLDGITAQAGAELFPLLFVSPTQINAQLPSELTPGQYNLLVRGENQPDATASFTVRRNAPGLFTNPVGSTPYALAKHADGSLVTPASPAVQGETVTLLGTGLGPYSGIAPDGLAIPAGMVLPLADTATIQSGGNTITPVETVAAMGYVGITAIQLKIDSSLPSSTNAALTVTVNGFQSNQVLLPIK
jgi:uncharacterized protein (TIGR03437 family)